ncbi:MAG: GNAT family N-acetyltransferase [Cyanobacteria bacterium J06632_22]
MVDFNLESIDRLTDHHVDELLQLYRQTAWWGRHRQRTDLEQMLAHTSLVIGFQEADTQRLVAFCRLLSDGVYRATVYDVMVAVDYQGQGLGRRLMDAVVTHPQLQQVEHVDLNCLPEMMPFYRKFGFQLITQVQLMRWIPGAAGGDS